MKAVIRFVKREPVRVYATLVSGMAVAISFGLDWSAEQQAAVLGFVAVVLGVGESVRANVSPVHKPE